MAHIPGADHTERRNFVRHFLEMIAAMFAGMAVLAGLVSLICALTGHQGLWDHAGASAPIMATSMSVGMAVWMRHLGHGWVPVGEMASAMYAPLAVLLIPFWAGVLPGGMLLAAMHVLMFPAMWIAMLHRPAEYVHDHHVHVGGPAVRVQ